MTNKQRKFTLGNYIASIPKGIEGYDELVRRINLIFSNAESAATRHTVPTSVLGVSKASDIIIENPPSQPEALLEEQLLTFLSERKGYERLSINNEDALIENFRTQISKFNEINFTDAEWDRFLNEFAKGNKTIEEKTRAVYSGVSFTRDDGANESIRFLDSKDPSQNTYQVLHQMRGTDTNDKNTRYDLTILVNGLPRVHFELKRPGVAIRQAFAQIERYVETSFLNSAYGLYGFVSLFVISNGTSTRYYSNTTRNRCIKARKNSLSGRSSKKDKTAKMWSNTFDWKTTDNLRVEELISFADSFCDPISLTYILADYTAITIDDELFVAKPYQIAAAEEMFNKVIMDFRQGRFNGPDANGYIWHATGSGKTFTSFLTSKLLAKHLSIRTNFLVDRKDLDSQTVREYNRFDRECVSLSKTSRSMRSKLDDLNQSLIVGIINKMSNIVSKATKKASPKNNPLPAFFYMPTVFIFDECHRSQFGNMQIAIQKAFKCYVEFGITGTPIFTENKHSGSINSTTADIFGEELHRYSITSAIADGAVLPYRMQIVPSRLLTKLPANVEDIPERSRVYTITPARIAANTEFILANHQKLVQAKGSIQVPMNDRRNSAGSSLQSKTKSISFDFREHFNAILTCDSIPMAAAYYKEIEKQQKERGTSLRVAMIYTSPSIEEDDSLEDNLFKMEGVKSAGRKALADAIIDYNKMFSTSFELTADSFPQYYESVSDKMKSADIDILIVVNMFLTGFDAPCVNTLYIDKPLKWHNLIQALGRTCRTCDAVKKWGEVVCFRDMEEDLRQAFTLYGGELAFEKSSIEPYTDVLDDYIAAEVELRTCRSEIASNPRTSLADKAEYITLFAAARVLRDKLTGYFSQDSNFDEDIVSKKLITEEEWMGFQSLFVDFRDEIQARSDSDDDDERKVIEALPDNVEFVSELISQYEIDTDWILKLIEDYQQDPGIESEQYPEIAQTVNRQFATSSARKSIMPWIEVLWTTEGKEAKDAYMRREYGEMLAALQSKYPDADKKGLVAFVATSIRSGEASSEGEQAKNLFPKGGLKNRRKYRRAARELVEDVQVQVGKWIQMESVFIGDVPWARQ